MQALLSHPKVRQVIHIATLWSPVWLGMTGLFFAMSVVYVFGFKKNVWLASQAITLRDETAGSTLRQGRFENNVQLKAAQETVLEQARNYQVIRNAFLAAGPEPSLFGAASDWPSNSLVKSFAESNLSVHAPKGAEFGSTEVVYLDVKHNSPERAIQLNKAICDSLENYMRQVRETRAKSIVEEVTQSRETARRELSKSTKRLQEIEKSIGADLPDLHNMIEIGGGSNSRTALDQLRLEARQLETKSQELETELQMLEKAAADPSSFVSAPGSLLNSQPGLKRLREGLVDAQIAQSQLSAKFTESHPSVTAARLAVADITERLNGELQAALQNAKQNRVSYEVNQKRLEAQQKGLEERMDRLAESRAVYANIVAEVKTRANILEQAERELAEAESSRLASLSSSLLTRVDQPVVGDKPIGPGNLTIILGSTLAGLFCGIGLTVLLNPLLNSTSYGRRRSDDANPNRRASDRVEERADAFLTNGRSHPAQQKPYGSGSVASEPSPVVRENFQEVEPQYTEAVAETPKKIVRERQAIGAIDVPSDEEADFSDDAINAKRLANMLQSATTTSTKAKTVPTRRPISEPIANKTQLEKKATEKSNNASDSGERRQLPRRVVQPKPEVAIGMREHSGTP